MKVMKSVTTILILCVVCIGCVSYPIVDEAITKLDANPVSIAKRFGLPETPPLKLEPQPAELLVGEWRTGLLRPACRSMGIFDSIVSSSEIYNNDSGIYDYDEKYMGVAQDYTFKADGSFCHTDGVQESVSRSILTRLGTWSYDSGILTLHYKKETKEFENHYLKAQREPNWKRDVTREINETVTCRVEWFAHNEISITEIEEKSSPQSGSRETIKVDAYGVKTKRTILVYGLKEGKEIGTVRETVYPPMHLKKIQ